MSDTIGLKAAAVQAALNQMDIARQTTYDNTASLAEIQIAQTKERYPAAEYAQQHLRLSRIITTLNTLMEANIASISETSKTIQGM
jgi:negative regulator of replication initiation